MSIVAAVELKPGITAVCRAVLVIIERVSYVVNTSTLERFFALLISFIAGLSRFMKLDKGEDD